MSRRAYRAWVDWLDCGEPTITIADGTFTPKQLAAHLGGFFTFNGTRYPRPWWSRIWSKISGRSS
jgi:hypothetical protein